MDNFVPENFDKETKKENEEVGQFKTDNNDLNGDNSESHVDGNIQSTDKENSEDKEINDLNYVKYEWQNFTKETNEDTDSDEKKELPVHTDNLREDIKNVPYYTESFKKTKKKKHGKFLKYVAIAVISAIFGGAIGAGSLLAIANSPLAVSSGLKNILGNSQKTAQSPSNIQIVSKEDSNVTAIAEKVSPSIVGIRTTPAKVTDFSSIFGGQSSQSSSPAEGSGIIISSDGYIVTNNHVIESAVSRNGGGQGKVEVILPNQTSKSYEATIVGTDSKTDLAVLKINATELPAAEIGDSDAVKVGELAVAVGNPGGIEYMGSITVGVISGKNRTVQTDSGEEVKFLQTDAAISPGNSGGALANSKGQIIGINTVKIVDVGFENLGFAIPINKAKEIINSLIKYKYVKGRPPILGVSIDPRFTEEIAKQQNVPMGLLVYDVTPLSGAYKAGIRAGDIITKFNNKQVKTFDELNNMKNSMKAGDKVKIEIYRDGKYSTVEVTLMEDKG